MTYNYPHYDMHISTSTSTKEIS